MNNDVHHQNQMHSVGFRSTWPIERARVAASACTSRSYCGLKGDDGTVVFDRLLPVNLDREGVAQTSACVSRRPHPLGRHVKNSTCHWPVAPQQDHGVRGRPARLGTMTTMTCRRLRRSSGGPPPRSVTFGRRKDRGARGRPAPRLRLDALDVAAGDARHGAAQKVEQRRLVGDEWQHGIM